MTTSNEQLDKIRHSTSHVMAYAVRELFGDKVKFAIGPTIDDGFYYDFDLNDQTFSPEDIKTIEKKMGDIIKKKLEFKKSESTIAEALEKMFNQPYKQELIKDLEKAEEKTVSFYTVGDFTDLCRGPHVENTKELGVFKLMKTAGAYWRGDEKNKMLQRIYGTAFETKEQLADYLRMMGEAEKRDHRKLGKELDLFVFSDLVGKGLPIFGPKGATIKRELERFTIDEELKRGYHHVVTPDLAKIDLYKKSGHYPYYKNTMYPVMKIDEEELILKPMTCPHHFMFYKSKPHSYRELPYRIGEIAHQYRYEKSGELSGLTRVRMFCLADAHIIAAKDQAKQVIKEVLELIDFINGTLGLIKGKDYRYRLSLGDRSDTKKYYKDDASWDYAENVLREVLTEVKAPFYEAANEAAFYGPKIDIQIKKVSGSEETAFTVQYDFVMPERFDLFFTNKEGEQEKPIVIHRSSIGCLERTMAFLIEHYAGAFPTWLSPVQAIIIPVSEKFTDYGQKVYDELLAAGVRVELDDADESLGKRIRTAEKQKTPYVLVVGERETKDETVAVRKRGEGDLGAKSIKEFSDLIQKEIEDKK
ncbi:MAG: threonine--tRNA ligase [Patescibacteria group bacterium]